MDATVIRTKPRKGISRKSLVKKADDAFSRFIRARDKRCVQCGKTDELTCGHLFSRIAYSTRWDEDGAMCQCKGHNMRHEFDPYPFMKLFIDIHGQAWVDSLHAKWSQPVKVKNYQLEKLARYFNQKADELNGGAE
jgi:hypothetical protein